MDKPKRKASLKYIKKKSEVPRNRLHCTCNRIKKPCENKSDSGSSMNLQKHFVIYLGIVYGFIHNYRD